VIDSGALLVGPQAKHSFNDSQSHWEAAYVPQRGVIREPHGFVGCPPLHGFMPTRERECGENWPVHSGIHGGITDDSEAADVRAAATRPFRERTRLWSVGAVRQTRVHASVGG
jgi:hypothetical protein